MYAVLYTIHVEIFPRDLISRLAMRDNAVCARGLASHDTRNINVASADHSQTFIHRENIRYYVIQTQLKMDSNHFSRTHNFPGEHAPEPP